MGWAPAFFRRRISWFERLSGSRITRSNVARVSGQGSAKYVANDSTAAIRAGGSGADESVSVEQLASERSTSKGTFRSSGVGSRDMGAKSKN
jgi:hypothetical protein